MRFKNIHVVINPASGNNEPILNTLNDIFKNYALDWDVSITRKAGDGAKKAKAALESGCDLIMAYGGDGTILDVAEGMLYSNVPLAILPGGTANALADELGIPPNLYEAAVLAMAEDVDIRTIDVGEAGKRHFLLRVGTGMIATFSEIVTREMKDRFGIAAYIMGGIQAITAPQYVKYRMTIDGEVIETEGTACLITNGNAIGALGIRLSPHVKIDDGLLDVFVVNNDVQSALAIAGSIAHIENPAIALQHWQGKEIEIDAVPNQGIYGDGENEAFIHTPCKMRILAGALKVVVTGNINSLMRERKNEN